LALQLVDFDAVLDGGQGDPAFHELQALLPLQFLLIAFLKKNAIIN
jgi:hypothetical protein